VRRINEAKQNGKAVEFVEDLRRLAYFAYVGTNPALSSPNFSLTLTDPNKEDGLPLLSEKNPAIQDKMPNPAWLSVSLSSASPTVSKL
jgi:hypothetical protein